MKRTQPAAWSQHCAVVSAVAVLTGLSCWADRAAWVGSWGATDTALADATILGYPLAAALSAWFASAPRRQRFEHLLDAAARSSLRVWASIFAALAGAVVTGAASVGVAALAATAREADFGQVPLPGLLASGCGYVAAAALGVLTGRVLPPHVAAAGAGACVYVVEVLATRGGSWGNALGGLMVANGEDGTYREALPWASGMRAVWLLAVAALLVAVASRHRTAWLPCFAAACLAATPLLLVGHGASREIPGARELTCRDFEAARVCLTKARRHTAAEVDAAAAPMLALLGGLDPGRIELVEDGVKPLLEPTLSGARLTVPFGVVNGVHGHAHVVDAKELQAELSTRLLRGACAASPSVGPDGSTPASPIDVLQRWLFAALEIDRSNAGLGAPLLHGLDYSEVDGFSRQWQAAEPAAHASWLARNRAAIVSCSPVSTAMS